MLPIAIHGAAGRMGRRLVALATADCQLKLVAAIDSPNHPDFGQDAGVLAGVGPLGITVQRLETLPKDTGAVIDFSTADAADAVIEACRRGKIPLVMATTALQPAQVEKLREAAQEIPLMHVANTSLAVNLTMKLCEVAARALADKDADVEILERHHRFKEDAPSGTALKFGEIISRVMGQGTQRHGREGRPGKRPHDEIGYHAIRVGDNPGEHTIVFALLGETIELTVRASNRDCYAQGALAAAKFLAGKPAGMYTMNDVLGL
jgi:4-hydroxy-tetrahydrodipicolinate reductase